MPQLTLAAPPLPPTEDGQMAEAVRLGIQHMKWKADHWEGADPARLVLPSFGTVSSSRVGHDSHTKGLGSG